MENFQTACAVADIAPNKSVAVTLGRQNILICMSNNEYFAVENQCTHQAAELDGGRIRNCFISCPLHGVRFNLKTGEPTGTLTRIALKTFPVRVVGEAIEVAID